MRTQMESGLTDEAIDQMAEQVKGRFERDEVERLLKSIKRTLVFTDSQKGSSAMVAFCDTEEDVRGVDALFDAMSPGDSGGNSESCWKSTTFPWRPGRVAKLGTGFGD